MTSDLINTMSADMNIPRFYNESDVSFAYRLCYSALGQWCLSIARNKMGNVIGTSKHNQTITLNELVDRYAQVFPDTFDFFMGLNNQQGNISVLIRRVYEETGYLLTNKENYNVLANFGRSVKVGKQALFFGLPRIAYTVNGLGVFSLPTSYCVTAKEFLIRDNLTCEEYFNSCFDLIDFYEKDINIQELEFFNPLSNNVPSMSWEKDLMTDCSIARKSETGPFFRVMQMPGGIQFADEPLEVQSDSFTSYEYRRLYFAMKYYYKNPLRVSVALIDEEYSKIRIGGYLPNREYYFLQLLSWPESSAYDKTSFIIRNSLLEEALTVLKNIGLKVEGGNKYEYR